MEFDLGGSGASPLEAEDPREIGSIPLLGRLGSGGMGRVYLGVVDGRYAAVKQVLPAFAEDRDFLRHFGHELDNLARLPQDVSAALLASDRTARPPWFATAYVPGLTLSQATELHGGPLSVPMLWLLLREIAAELKAVHALDMVHRDLKPSNVMLTEEGVTLIDFGVARAADQSRLTKTGMLLGTPAYMSPEQANGLKEFTGATDVWALGALIAYAASGEPPFGEGSGVDLLYRIVHTEPDLERVRALDTGLAECLAACLDKNPQARPSADRLHQLGRQKCGAPQPGWPQEVMLALAERSTFARVPAPVVAASPAELAQPEPAPVPEAGAEPDPAAEPLSKAPVVLSAEPPTERPRRRSKLLLTALPILLAAGTAFSVILLPKLYPLAGGSDTPSPSVSVTASGGAPSSSPSGSASPSGDASGAPTPGTTPPGGASASPRPASSPSSGPNGGTTRGSGTGSGGNGGAAGGTSGGNHGTSGGSRGGSGSAPGTVTHWSAYFQGFYVGYAKIPILVSWTQVSGATSYDIHYTNDGKGNPGDRTDTVIPVGDASSYTINSQYSGDDICIWLRADNSYGRSAWSQSICTTTPE